MADPKIISVTLSDEDGQRAALKMFCNIAGTDTLADLNTYAATFLPKVDAVTDGKIESARAIIPLTLPGGLKSSAVSGAEIERTGLFNFSVTGSKYRQSIDIPTMANSLTVGNKIDLTQTDVAALVSLLLTLTQGVQATSEWAAVLVAALDAAKTFRKHRRSAKRV